MIVPLHSVLSTKSADKNVMNRTIVFIPIMNCKILVLAIHDGNTMVCDNQFSILMFFSLSFLFFKKSLLFDALLRLLHTTYHNECVRSRWNFKQKRFFSYNKTLCINRYVQRTGFRLVRTNL